MCSIFLAMAQTFADFCVRKKLWKTLSKVYKNYAEPSVFNLQSHGTNMYRLLHVEETLENPKQGV
jgi:hypothetical protein